MTSIPDWSPTSPTWTTEQLALLPNEITIPEDISVPKLIEKSDNFPIRFPIETNRCKFLKTKISEETLNLNINSVYPLVHENVLHLYVEFLLDKRSHGTNIEKQLYKNMKLIEFVDRLLKKRAVTFMGRNDSWLLIDGRKGSKNWETIGSVKEKPPLCLTNCLSYDEIKLSAFLSVSSFTYFVNLGERKNFGVFKQDREQIEEKGVIIGLIGARLVKDQVMEYQELVISKKQNIKKNGYGKVRPPTIHHLFANFYNEQCLEFDEIINREKQFPQRFTHLKNEEIFDNYLYYKRLVFSIDTLLIEANQRALNENTTAFVHVVGLGLGVWMKSPKQIKIYMDSFGKRITILGKFLKNISDICFVWINCDTCLDYKNGDLIPIDGHPLDGIRIHMNKRNPHERLIANDMGKLLVVSYAWDGNALPGNEFWINKLGSSGDSAAASSTQITELHNPFINMKVNAMNLRIITNHGNIFMLEDYIKSVRNFKRKLDES